MSRIAIIKTTTFLMFLGGNLLGGLALAHDSEDYLNDAIPGPVAESFWSMFLADAHAAGKVSIKRKGDYRYIESDGLPDHATGRFPNAHNPHTISEQAHKFRVPLKPEKRRSPSFVAMSAFGVALNGVPFDPATAEYWNNERKFGWNIDAMSRQMKPGLDQNNAHVQPNGTYHYHGIPTALMERGDQYSAPIMLGYAADGFPVYGPYGYKDANDPNSELVNLFPSYRLHEGDRPGGPGGKFDGTYTKDYQFVEGSGDLDRCNGREGVTPEYPKGTYYYVITDSYPFIPRCWMGKADDSFRKGPPPGRGGPGDTMKGKKRQPKPREERRGIDMRNVRPSLDAISACQGRRSGSFCSYRTRTLQVIQGTCRSNGASLICIQIGG